MILPARIDQTRRSRGKIARFVLVCVTSLVFSGLNFSNSSHAQTAAEIKLVFGPNVSPAHQEAFHRFVPQVQPFFAKVLGRPRQVAATIYVYATLEERKQAYMQLKGVSAERASVVLRDSIANAHPSQEIWFRMDTPCFDARTHGPGCNFAKILIHELFHLWQHEFSAEAYLILPTWITEGSAEFIGFLGAVEMGALRRGEVDQYLNDLARSTKLVRLSQLNSRAEWDALNANGDLHQISGLAFFRLAEKSPTSLTVFYQAISEKVDWLQAFEKAFDRPFAQFDAEFTAYIRSLR